jgi:coenzyme F420-reducing hydrogenase alpha subunit
MWARGHGDGSSGDAFCVERGYHLVKGLVAAATIVPPTSQNLARIEADLRAFVPTVLQFPEPEAARRCEHLIRTYDPCISCAAHFLRFAVESPVS